MCLYVHVCVNIHIHVCVAVNILVRVQAQVCGNVYVDMCICIRRFGGKKRKKLYEKKYYVFGREKEKKKCSLF